MTLFDRVFGGNDYNYNRTVAAIDAAVAQYGEAEPVAFPNTAYNLPCYYSITGKKNRPRVRVMLLVWPQTMHAC